MKRIKKQGCLNHEGEMVDHPLSYTLFTDHESCAVATSSSIGGNIAFSPNASKKKVTKIGSGFGYLEEIPLASAIIPPPKAHLVMWSGVFAPGSPYRKIVVLKPKEKKGRLRKSVC